MEAKLHGHLNDHTASNYEFSLKIIGGERWLVLVPEKNENNVFGKKMKEK